MKYLLQVRFHGVDAAIDGLPADARAQITREFQAIRKLPGVLDGNQLEPVATAKTVRVTDGQTLTSEGPGADDATAINGYYVLDAADLETAIAFAARIPVARMGGTVEVRAMIER